MKIILSTLLLLFTVCVTAQRQGVTKKELKELVGNWAGTVTYTYHNDDTTRKSMPVQLVIVEHGDSLIMTFTFTEPGGHKVIDISSLRLYDEGDKLGIAGQVYFLAAVRRRGIRLTLIGEREGVENDKEVDIRQTINIGPSILNIRKEVRYTGMKDYFMRNKMELVKK